MGQIVLLNHDIINRKARGYKYIPLRFTQEPLAIHVKPPCVSRKTTARLRRNSLRAS